MRAAAVAYDALPSSQTFKAPPEVTDLTDFCKQLEARFDAEVCQSDRRGREAVANTRRR